VVLAPLDQAAVALDAQRPRAGGPRCGT